MKIVCISASEVPSSKANAIQAMKACQALAQVGHEVRLLVPRFWNRDPCSTDTWADIPNLYGLQVSFPIEWLPANPRWKRYDFCWRAVRRALELGAEAVYAWPLQSAVFALLWCLPVLLELHGPPEGALGPLLFRLFLSLSGRKRLLVITQALLDLLEPTYHASRIPHTVAPNGIDLERYQALPEPPEARRELGLIESPTVGYTGHLYPGRGMSLMVELASRFPDVQFLWVGGNPQDVETWRNRLATQGVGNVILAGFVENSRLPMYQAAADVLIMPYEGAIAGSSGGNSALYCSPMKMFEYMACGRAIVSSDLPVIREVLNERNAVLCPPEDAESWARALRELIADPGRRQALAQQVLKDAQQYTWVERARRATDGFCE
jgi:glycosyltransferase involved in cell wall biosynthesis